VDRRSLVPGWRLPGADGKGPPSEHDGEKNERRDILDLGGWNAVLFVLHIAQDDFLGRAAGQQAAVDLARLGFDDVGEVLGLDGPGGIKNVFEDLSLGVFLADPGQFGTQFHPQVANAVAVPTEDCG
jgi:hypothetical protein